MVYIKIIELFDESPIENIFGICAFKPQEAVYMGSIREDVFEKKYLSSIKEYFKAKGLENLRLSYVQVRRNNINDAVMKLEREVNCANECLIDIIGGDDVLLAAAGIVHERRPKVTLFRINPYSGKAIIIDDSVTSASDPDVYTSNASKYAGIHTVNNTVEENAVLHGGALAAHGGNFTYTDELKRDIDKLWQLCSKGPRGYMHKRSAPQTWNQFVFRAAGIDRMNKAKQLEALKKYKVQKYLEDLKAFGLIDYQLRHDGTLTGFTYKNEHIRAFLHKAGDALEQKVYLTLCKYLGKGLNDVKVGATLEWNAEHGKGELVTENEIDVFAMRGAVPVLISCKNGKFTSDELYKISTVADKFAGKYAKKILIASDFAHCADAQTVKRLRARAAEMNIKIVENVHRLSDEEFEKTLKRAVLG